MRTLSFVFALGIAMGLTLAVTPAEAARPGNALSLQQLSVGERSRTVQNDGGGLMLWVTDAGIGSVAVTGGTLVYIANAGTLGCFVCLPGPEGVTSWDGGCGTVPSDPNFGQFLDAGASWLVLLKDTTTLIETRPAPTVQFCTLPVWTMR